MIQRFLGLLILFLASFSLVTAQEALPPNLGTDTYSTQYKIAFGVLNQFRNQNPAVQAYENRISPLQRALQSLKTQLRNLMASFENIDEEITPVDPVDPDPVDPIIPVPPTPPPSRNCGIAQPPILGGNEDIAPEDYSEIAAGGHPFPGSFGGSMGFSIDRGKYSALKFNSGTTTVNRAKHVLTTPSTGQGPIPVGNTYAISECPGDFSTHLDQPACLKVGGFQTLKWSIGADSTDPAYCHLDKNKIYYMNFIHSITPSNGFTTSSCGVNSCGILMSSVPVDYTPPISSPSLNCAVDQPPILNGAEDRTIISNGTNNPFKYDGTFKDFQYNQNTDDWPGGTSDAFGLSLNPNQYISASFTTNNTSQTASLIFGGTGNTQGPLPDGQIVAISKCPGDFSIHLNKPKCISFRSLRWSTNPNANENTHCKLDKLTNYYFNIVHSNNSENDNYETSDCARENHCGIIAAQTLEE
jgi:hypothetical protein